MAKMWLAVPTFQEKTLPEEAKGLGVELEFVMDEPDPRCHVEGYGNLRVHSPRNELTYVKEGDRYRLVFCPPRD